MWETIRGYLTFNRKERIGVLFLLVLMVVLFVLPYWFRPVAGTRDPAAYDSLKDGIRKFEKGGLPAGKSYAQLEHEKPGATSGQQYQGRNQPQSSDPQIRLFNFDPNKISTEQWQQLGLSERLSQTIKHYVEKGGRFRRAKDLRKLYGLHPDDYERLLPYVRIGQQAANGPPRTGYYSKMPNIGGLRKADSFYKARSEAFVKPERAGNETPARYAAKKYQQTDVNAADSIQWALLPGIGEKLASRIVHFREKLGGFVQADQVGETFGLPDSTFQKIKSYLVVHSRSVSQIDLNGASKETLQSHPYVRWKLAKLITDYRVQHGLFHSVDELLQLAGIDGGLFEKIKPYFLVK